MTKGIQILFLSMLIILIGACLSIIFAPDENSDIEIRNVVRVFMHEPNSYTFLVQKPGEDIVKMVSKRTLRASGVFIITGVPENEDMCVRVVTVDGFIQRLEIHVHSVKNIEGGGWNRDRSGKGTTHVVE